MRGPISAFHRRRAFYLSIAAQASGGAPVAHQIEHFGRVTRGEAKRIVSARDGLQNLRITEAIAEAARTGKLVDTFPS